MGFYYYKLTVIVEADDEEQAHEIAIQSDEIETEVTYLGARECSECGEYFSEGYLVNGGEQYYCSDTCLHKHHTPKEWAKMYADDDDNNYHTAWEDGQ